MTERSCGVDQLGGTGVPSPRFLKNRRYQGHIMNRKNPKRESSRANDASTPTQSAEKLAAEKLRIDSQAAAEANWLSRLPLGRLPQEGWYLDREWAAIFGEEPRTFRKKIRAMRCPHKKFGAVMIVDAQIFYDSLPDGDFGEDDE